MLKSMTGYGKATAGTANRTLAVEIRSLNSKQLDLNIRLPQWLRDREADIRMDVARVMERGKVDVTLSVENDTESASVSINTALVKKYHAEIRSLAAELNEPTGADLLAAILRFPEVMKNERESIDEEEWKLIRTAVAEALKSADQFRITEGRLLEEEICKRIMLILQLLQEVEPFEQSRITQLRERLERNRDEFAINRQGLESFDENRFEQEIFWYLERLDITEEKVRLKKHCEYFLETVKGNDSNGRKLNFITQEIGREINTLGSKASHAEIQKLVVQMKDELEKVKEQLLNVL
jgi:uncharacterized protein (TIGR00255 family)